MALPLFSVSVLHRVACTKQLLGKPLKGDSRDSLYREWRREARRMYKFHSSIESTIIDLVYFAH